MYWVAKATLGMFLRIVFRPRVTGKQHVPRQGAAIMASNHLSFSDSFFMPAGRSGPQGHLHGQVGLLHRSRASRACSAAGSSRMWWARSRSTARAARPARPRCAPPCRSWGRATCSASIPKAPARLTAGCTGVKTGVARMALEAGVPVIPVAMIGTDRAAAAGQGHAQAHASRSDVRRAAGLLPVRRDGERPSGAPGDHRRDHARAAGACRARSTRTSTRRRRRRTSHAPARGGAAAGASRDDLAEVARRRRQRGVR